MKSGGDNMREFMVMGGAIWTSSLSAAPKGIPPDKVTVSKKNVRIFPLPVHDIMT